MAASNNYLSQLTTLNNASVRSIVPVLPKASTDPVAVATSGHPRAMAKRSAVGASTQASAGVAATPGEVAAREKTATAAASMASLNPNDAALAAMEAAKAGVPQDMFSVLGLLKKDYTPTEEEAAATSKINKQYMMATPAAVAAAPKLVVPKLGEEGNTYESAAAGLEQGIAALDAQAAAEKQRDDVLRANTAGGVGVDPRIAGDYAEHLAAATQIRDGTDLRTKKKVAIMNEAVLRDDGDPYTPPGRIIEGIAVTFDRNNVPTFHTGNAASQLVAAQALKDEEYERVYRAENQRLMSTIGSNPNLASAIVETQASKRAEMKKDAAAMAERMAGRYGVQLDEAGKQGTDDKLDHAIAKGRTLALSSARDADMKRDEFISEAMINLGKGIEAVGLEELTNASNTINSIDQQNKQIAAQNKAALYSTAGQILSVGAMFATGGAAAPWVLGGMAAGGAALAASA